MNSKNALLSLAGLTVLVSAGVVLAESDRVTITGGPDDTQHNYTWQVTNHNDSRLVYIEFPHYRADLFITPSNWDQKTENLAAKGWKDRPGVCIATAGEGYPGLARGATTKFEMRIGSGGALHGTGTVKVKFEDGSEASIPGVDLPVRPERGSSYMALIGTGAIFVIFILFNERRRRRQAAKQAVD